MISMAALVRITRYDMFMGGCSSAVRIHMMCVHEKLPSALLQNCNMTPNFSHPNVNCTLSGKRSPKLVLKFMCTVFLENQVRWLFLKEFSILSVILVQIFPVLPSLGKCF
jgi:hypothetical protein